MKEPKAINLQTDGELLALGWAAVARDEDGHAMSVHAPFVSQKETGKYLAEEYERGRIVTRLQ